MDSFEASTSMNEAPNRCRVNEVTNNRKGTSRQESDSNETVFTSMSHETISSIITTNGPSATVLSTSSNIELEHQLNGLANNHTGQCINNIHREMSNSANNSNVKQYDGASGSNCDVNARDNGVGSSSGIQSCQRRRVYLDTANSSNSNVPSTSGTSAGKPLVSSQQNSNPKESRKRPSTLRLNRRNLEDDSSSDTGNDDYSLGSEDGCIYTYRGGEHLADLPSSFFSLDMGLPLDNHLPIPPNYPVPQQAAVNVREQASRTSSPDMDFLEMDFDPGPSCEVDTGDESSPDVDLEVINLSEEIEPVIRGTSPEYLPAAVQPQPVAIPPQPSLSNEAEPHCSNEPSTSKGLQLETNEENATSCQTYGPYITHVNARGEQLLVRRTMGQWPTNATMHISSGDLISPREIINYDEQSPEGVLVYQINAGERPALDSANLSAAFYHVTMAKRLMNDKIKSEGDSLDTENSKITQKDEGTSTDCNVACVEPPRCMVWSEREACERQVTQIGTSACGATAVVNVFIALGVPVNQERINLAVGTRLRANNAPIPRYLLSRAVAGCTAADIVTGIQRASDGLVTARFFPTYPERAMSLSHWLADWISLGAVPILTMNLQAGCEGEVPDAWHHQMVWGVSARGVHVSNPVECVPESALWPRLTSPAELLVRARDVLARFTPAADLTPLAAVPDPRFRDLNVLGQVVNAIREWRATGWSEYGTRTRHIRVPAAYQAGVTVAALTGSEAHRRLMHAPLPPVLAPNPHPPPRPA